MNRREIISKAYNGASALEAIMIVLSVIGMVVGIISSIAGGFSLLTFVLSIIGGGIGIVIAICIGSALHCLALIAENTSRML